MQQFRHGQKHRIELSPYQDFLRQMQLPKKDKEIEKRNHSDCKLLESYTTALEDSTPVNRGGCESEYQHRNNKINKMKISKQT